MNKHTTYDTNVKEQKYPPPLVMTSLLFIVIGIVCIFFSRIVENHEILSVREVIIRHPTTMVAVRGILTIQQEKNEGAEATLCDIENCIRVVVVKRTLLPREPLHVIVKGRLRSNEKNPTLIVEDIQT